MSYMALYRKFRPTDTSSRISRILSTPLLEAASISITFMEVPAVIERQAVHFPQGYNIREIREEVAYSPTEGKYKVYIIDEVHMLSIGAFNALLIGQILIEIKGNALIQKA